MPKLFVVGDSFSELSTKYKPDWLPWTVLLSSKIGYDLVPMSIPGCDQDWQIRELRKLSNIDKDDRILLVLTSPQRFWYFKDQPWMSNVVYGTYATELVKDKDKLLAIQMFYNHIWREDLFLSFQQSRLSEISWMTHVHKWQKPTIISAFGNCFEGDYSNLNIIKGNLYEDIQYKEYSGRIKGQDALMNGEWANYDCRINHMCRSNHEKLVEVLIDPVLNGTDLDLSKIQFHDNIITEENACDREFAKDQLCLDIFDLMMDTKFREKLGLTDTLRRLWY